MQRGSKSKASALVLTASCGNYRIVFLLLFIFLSIALHKGIMGLVFREKDVLLLCCSIAGFEAVQRGSRNACWEGWGVVGWWKLLIFCREGKLLEYRSQAGH